MRDIIRFRVLMVTFLMFQALYRLLCIPCGLLVVSATGLLLVQQYWLAMLVLVTALAYYEAIYWLLIGRWMR